MIPSAPPDDDVRAEAERHIVGHSAGAWGALSLARENPETVSAIIAFAPGRGGHANDFPNRVCAPHTLLASAAEFGRNARVLSAAYVPAQPECG